MILEDDKQVEALEARRAAEEQLNVQEQLSVRCLISRLFRKPTILTMKDSRNPHQPMHLCNPRQVLDPS